MKAVISSGHGLKIRGASYTDPDGWGLDEVDEARRVVAALAQALRKRPNFEVEEIPVSYTHLTLPTNREV